MVMPGHICPYGLKAKHLLKRRGFAVDDRWLTTRAEVDAFKAEHGVQTTPQTFIDGVRIGGYDDLRRHFGLTVADPDAVSYRPVIALFAMTALMALAASFAAFGNAFTMQAGEWFISFSMVVLALLKLQDIDKFATMFLNYDLLARRWVPYADHLSLCRGAGGRVDDRARAAVAVDPRRAVHRRHRRGVGVQGGLYRQARAEMRLRRRQQPGAAGLCVADRKSGDGRHGILDAMDAGVTMIRHLLLALFLIGLSLPSVTAPVQAEAMVTDCHGAMPVEPSHHQPDADDGKAAAHVCIGCVASTPAVAAAAPMPLPALLPPILPMATLTGANAPPSIPPPRP